MKTKRRIGLASATLVALLVGGCGGGDDGPPAVTSQVPASASESPQGFIAYVKALVASSADRLQPVDVSMVTAPTSETNEPIDVD